MYFPTSSKMSSLIRKVHSGDFELESSSIFIYMGWSLAIYSRYIFFSSLVDSFIIMNLDKINTELSLPSRWNLFDNNVGCEMCLDSMDVQIYRNLEIRYVSDLEFVLSYFFFYKKLWKCWLAGRQYNTTYNNDDLDNHLFFWFF